MTRKIKRKTKRITSRKKRKTKRREKKTRKMTRKTKNKKIKIKKTRKKKIKRVMAIRKSKTRKIRSKTIKIRKTRKRARRTKKLSTKPWTSSAKESQRPGHGSRIRVTGSVKSATRVKFVPTFATTTFPSRQLSSVIMENGWTLDSLMTNVSKFLARPLTINSIHNSLYILILATKNLTKSNF